MDSALVDGDLLLRYAAYRGVLDNEMLTEIVTAREALRAKPDDATAQISYWGSVSKLAVSVQPATIAGLRATAGLLDGSPTTKRWWSRVVKNEPSGVTAIRRYTLWSGLALMVLIIVQVYYLVGATALDEIDRLQGGTSRASSEFLFLREKQPAVSGDPNELYGRLHASFIMIHRWNGIWSAPVAAVQAILFGKEQVEQGVLISVTCTAALSGPPVSWLSMTKQALTSSPRADGSTPGVDPSSAVSSVVPLTAPATASPAVLPGAQHTANEDAVRGTAIPVTGSTAAAANSPQQSPGVWAVDPCIQERMREVSQARVTLTCLQYFFLPAFYGLVGTLVFILRNLSSGIQERSFSSDVGYRLRWSLGALTGVTIAEVIRPDTYSGLASISPLGLAFLGGYAVEILFSTMDRLVGAFSADPTLKK